MSRLVEIAGKTAFFHPGIWLERQLRSDDRTIGHHTSKGKEFKRIAFERPCQNQNANRHALEDEFIAISTI